MERVADSQGLVTHDLKLALAPSRLCPFAMVRECTGVGGCITLWHAQVRPRPGTPCTPAVPYAYTLICIYHAHPRHPFHPPSPAACTSPTRPLRLAAFRAGDGTVRLWDVRRASGRGGSTPPEGVVLQHYNEADDQTDNGPEGKRVGGAT